MPPLGGRTWLRHARRRPARTVGAIASLLALGWLVPLASGPAIADTAVFLNEIHYDNSGADTNEGVEVAGPAGTDLSGWSIVLYNGLDGSTYGTAAALTGTVPDQQSGFGTAWFSIEAIQNGAPDGLALVDPGGVTIQFVSYEGAFAATEGPANGMTSTDIGVAEAGTEPVDQSLQLGGTGTVAEDFAWQPSLGQTRGAVNQNQTFGQASACTISGTSGPDSLTGTPGPDHICGLGGNDILTGLGGDDTIEGGDGNDSMRGGTGADTLRGEAGNDVLSPGSGDDPETDGGTGTNTVSYFDAPAGVSIDLGAQTATGGAGTDPLVAVANAIGSNVDDTVTGNAVRNVLRGRGGQDSLSGGGGVDQLDGGPGNDALDGGAGQDAADYIAAGGAVTVNLELGTATGAAGNDTLAAVEDVYGSDAGGDHLTGRDDGANNLFGRGGNDAMFGRSGHDRLFGGPGDDYHEGGPGNDLCLDEEGAGNEFVNCERP
jgi:Ca2+-binding RTX toxin-like protein